jgi:hypothetical protein
VPAAERGRSATKGTPKPLALYGVIGLIVGFWLIATSPIRKGYFDEHGRMRGPSRTGFKAWFGMLVSLIGLGIIVYALGAMVLTNGSAPVVTPRHQRTIESVRNTLCRLLTQLEAGEG